jgi:anti-sigma factor RsiW
MRTTPTPPPSGSVTPDELACLFDGALPPEQAQAVQTRLSTEDRDTLAAWAQQRDALRALGRSIAAEPIPPELLQATDRTGAAQSQRQRWQRWGGMAAAVVLAFGTGWLSRGGMDAQHLSAGSPAGAVASVTPARGFVLQAAVAYATYVPEVRHPVEVGAAQQAHLVQWLSKRLGRVVHVPDLSAQGYELIGGRLLPGQEGARAQFMFQKPGGARVTLYLGALASPSTGKPAQSDMQNMARETAFAFDEKGDIASFYWVDQGFGYALSGQLPKTELGALAELAYRNL